MKIEISEKQLSNLLVFLNRVQTQGYGEAGALTEVAIVLQKAKQGLPQEVVKSPVGPEIKKEEKIKKTQEDKK